MSLKSNIKGFLGERKVKKFLKKHQKQLNAKTLNNVKLNINGKTIQIDHIFITPNNIYVIETKNLNGTIQGNFSYSYWKIYYKNNKYYKILNPIIQNSYHVKAIETITKIPAQNVLIFTGKANTTNLNNYYINTLENFEKKLNKESFYDFLSFNFVERIYNLIKSNLSSFSKKQHIINIENRPKSKYKKYQKSNYYKKNFPF